MIAKYCPECRHDITGRGRFCMFCGCDLRKNPPVSATEKKEPKKNGDTWDPEEVYQKKSSVPKKAALVILLAALAVVIAFVSVAFIGGGGKNGLSKQLRAGMTFEEAARVMKRNGFEADGEPEQQDGKTFQEYKRNEVYGYTTLRSVLRVEEGADGGITLTHYFNERKLGGEKESWDLLMLRSKLSGQHGDPQYHADGVFPFYSWQDDGAVYLLYSTGKQIVIIESR